MFDVRLIAENKDKVLKNLMDRNFSDTTVIDQIEDLNRKRKELVSLFEQMKAPEEMKVEVVEPAEKEIRKTA